ncbi:hypothetical protein L479_02137 [Exiguobacterium sp. S17]|nr:hypothetical protein L479_02137 [Exiguobacterium sp. S17]
MRKWMLPLALALMLGACGNEEVAPIEETKRPLPDAVETVYESYQQALRDGDATALAEIDYAGELTDIPATGAVTRDLAPGDIVASWVNEDEDVAYIVHEMEDGDGNELPNRLAKVAIKEGDDWSLVVTPALVPADVIGEVGELLTGIEASDYGVNAEANARLADVPEDEAGPIYDRVNAQTDYVALEADNNVFLLMSETLTVPENQAIMTDYFKAYQTWYVDNEAALRDAAATEDPVDYLEVLDPLKQKLEQAIDGYDEQLVDPSFG